MECRRSTPTFLRYQANCRAVVVGRAHGAGPSPDVCMRPNSSGCRGRAACGSPGFGGPALRTDVLARVSGLLGHLLRSQPRGLLFSRRAARAGAYIRALMVPRVSPALLTCAWAISMAVERRASSSTARSTIRSGGGSGRQTAGGVRAGRDGRRGPADASPATETVGTWPVRPGARRTSGAGGAASPWGNGAAPTHGMRSSWRSMPSSSLLPHRSTSFPSVNLLICMPR